MLTPGFGSVAAACTAACAGGSDAGGGTTPPGSDVMPAITGPPASAGTCARAVSAANASSAATASGATVLLIDDLFIAFLLDVGSFPCADVPPGLVEEPREVPLAELLAGLRRQPREQRRVRVVDTEVVLLIRRRDFVGAEQKAIGVAVDERGHRLDGLR